MGGQRAAAPFAPASAARRGLLSAKALARQCEQSLAVEGQVFAQSEPLWKRVEGLLNKYNDEKDIFVEQCAHCPTSCSRQPRRC